MLVLFALSFALELIPTQLLAKVGGKSEADKESAKRDKNILTCTLFKISISLAALGKDEERYPMAVLLIMEKMSLPSSSPPSPALTSGARAPSTFRPTMRMVTVRKKTMGGLANKARGRAKIEATMLAGRLRKA